MILPANLFSVEPCKLPYARTSGRTRERRTEFESSELTVGASLTEQIDCTASRSIMLDSLHAPMGDPVKGEDTGLDWYMNKSFKSRTVKVLSSVHGGCCKLRFMDDLLGGQHDITLHARPTEPNAETSAFKGSFNVSDAAYDLNTGQDEDDDIGNMTLKEMRQLFKKSVPKVSEKKVFSISSSVGPSLENAPANGRMPMPNCTLQSSGLELHLDSSTSNSAESSDDLSPCCIATSSHKPINSVKEDVSPCGFATFSWKQTDSMAHDSEHVGEVVDCPRQPSKKRKSTTDLVVCKSETSIADDDCTLEMWQVHKRRCFIGKKPRRSGLAQASCIDEQISCESSKAHETTDEQISCESSKAHETTPVLSSANLAPGVDDLLAKRTSSFDVSRALVDFEQESSAPCSSDLSEEPRKNSLESQGGLITSIAEIERGGFKCGTPYPAVSIGNAAGVRRGDVKNDDQIQKHGPLLCETSPVCSSRESLQGDDLRRIPFSAEEGSWLLKPCSRSLSVKVSASTYGKSESNRQEPRYPCETRHSNSSSLIALVENGQSASVEEICCGINKANSLPLSMRPCVPPVGVRDELVMVNDQVVDLSQKDTDGIWPVDLPCHSPPLSAKLNSGLSDADHGTNNGTVVSQPLLDEDSSGSPINLFSTERLDTEEERELEQVKPSKIPSKRKAISPLSRERLLQATKYGDREQDFTDLDKRGLKKLPRAFKGFIGRDTFNQIRLAAFSQAKSSVALESSPSEKPHLKEEVVPGSPCHNREKLLPSKHLAPKKSPISSSYRSSCAAVSTMQTSPSCVQRLSLVLNSSPSPPSLKILRAVDSKSPPVTSISPVPAKGILRSSSPTCQGACKCEECVSLRSRAEKAAEFSQRQMHDIEGLAVKLLKELNTMRCLVEESLIHRSALRTDSPRSTTLSLEQVKRAANNACETEKMAKSWLVRMARDCNRYCKIMRMQERKLSFADESGGQLCHVKLFHAQAQTQAQADIGLPTEKSTSLPSIEKGNASPTEEPPVKS